MVTPLHGYTVTQVHRYTGTPLHGYTFTWLHGYTVTRLHLYTHRCTVTPLHGYTVTRLHAPLHRYTVTKCSTTKLVRSDCFMCHLDSMRVAQNPLPLPEPYDKLWLSVTKVQHVSLRLQGCTESLQSPMICCGYL